MPEKHQKQFCQKTDGFADVLKVLPYIYQASLHPGLTGILPGPVSLSSTPPPPIRNSNVEEELFLDIITMGLTHLRRIACPRRCSTPSGATS